MRVFNVYLSSPTYYYRKSLLINIFFIECLKFRKTDTTVIIEIFSLVLRKVL